MAKNGDPGINADFFVDALGDVHGAAGTLRHHDHVVGDAGQTGPADLLHDVAVKIQLPLGNQHGGGAHGDAYIQGQIPRVAAHDLHHGAALMGLHGVPQLVDAFDGGVAGGVKADGVVGAADVVVNSGGDAHHLQVQPLLRGLTAEGQGASEGAVSADGHDTVQPQEPAGGQGFGPAGGLPELLAAGGVQHGAALVDNVADAGGAHVGKVAGDEAVPASPDTYALHALANGRADHGADSRVHARGVSAAGQNANTFDLFLHRSPRTPSNADAQNWYMLEKLAEKRSRGSGNHLPASYQRNGFNVNKIARKTEK